MTDQKTMPGRHSMGVFTLFTLFTLFFDSAGWLIECKNPFVKVRRFVLRLYYSTNVLICKSCFGELPDHCNDPLQSPVCFAVYARNVVLGTGVVRVWQCKASPYGMLNPFYPQTNPSHSSRLNPRIPRIESCG